MLTIEQCKTYAAEYKILGKDPNNSDRKSSMLGSISNSLTALAHQLESLAAIVKDEPKVRPPPVKGQGCEIPASPDSNFLF